MSKKNLHIKKYLNEKLPEPEVQADDAWAQMNDMLGNNSPAPDSQVPGDSHFSSLLKGGLGLIAILGIVGSIWFFLPGNNQKNKAALKSENLSQDKNTSQYPIRTEHGEDTKNTLTKRETIKDSSGSIFSPDENKNGKKTTVSMNEQPDKLRPDKNSAIITNPSIQPKKEYFTSKSVKKGADTHTVQSGHSGSESHVSSSTKFERQQKVENNVTRNNTTRNTQPNVVPLERSKSTDQNNKSQNRTPGDRATGLDYSDAHIQKNTDNTGKQPISGFIENQDVSKKVAFSVQNLTPKSVHFNNLSKNLAKIVKYNSVTAQQKTSSSKEKKALFETLHVGLEWNAASALNSTKYIFTATDSTNKPYMLLIPGIWLSKDLTENQSLTLSFYANQTYFGGLKRIQRIGADSATFHENINLIKAAGINLSLQYNYHVISKLGVSAGVSYSPLRSALAQSDVENYLGEILPGPKLLLKKDNIAQYMKTNLFMVKTGLTFTPGRYQLGINLLIPFSNLSVTPTSSMKTVNGQFFFRFRIK
ncbi:hypothetical protein [Dyadobacter diqingensis]|uniref:hypothetical protein n=1 Tax=Dyadobacter diqingensis TaxID=2938121 RepID=UPI0020C1A538|nr:hypothetical protein [Dyadobacter diqingensis]